MMLTMLDDGREVESVSTYELDALNESDFREVLAYLIRDVLNITHIHLVRSYGRVQHVSFIKGD